MPEAAPTPVEVLEVSRTFAAPRDRVFAAWTQPEHLNRWFAPNEEYAVTAAVDLRVGGAYRIEMNHQNGNNHTVFGEYREITEPEKLVFTWSWESGMATGTLVTLRFLEKGAETEVIVHHEKLPTNDVRAEHGKGWKGCLNRLDAFLAA